MAQTVLSVGRDGWGVLCEASRDHGKVQLVKVSRGQLGEGEQWRREVAVLRLLNRIDETLRQRRGPPHHAYVPILQQCPLDTRVLSCTFEPGPTLLQVTRHVRRLFHAQQATRRSLVAEQQPLISTNAWVETVWGWMIDLMTILDCVHSYFAPHEALELSVDHIDPSDLIVSARTGHLCLIEVDKYVRPLHSALEEATAMEELARKSHRVERAFNKHPFQFKGVAPTALLVEPAGGGDERLHQHLHSLGLNVRKVNSNEEAIRVIGDLGELNADDLWTDGGILSHKRLFLKVLGLQMITLTMRSCKARSRTWGSTMQICSMLWRRNIISMCFNSNCLA